MRRLVIAVIIAIVIGIGVLVALLVFGGNNKTVSDEAIRQATYTGFDKYKFNHNGSALEIKDIAYLKERWVVATIILTDEPKDSEAKEMVYIYSKNEKVVELIAFSGDGFSRSSFPETMTYDDVTEILQGVEEDKS